MDHKDAANFLYYRFEIPQTFSNYQDLIIQLANHVTASNVAVSKIDEDLLKKIEQYREIYGQDVYVIIAKVTDNPQIEYAIYEKLKNVIKDIQQEFVNQLRKIAHKKLLYYKSTNNELCVKTSAYAPANDILVQWYGDNYHEQIYDQLKEAGPDGVAIDGLCAALHQILVNAAAEVMKKYVKAHNDGTGYTSMLPRLLNPDYKLAATIEENKSQKSEIKLPQLATSDFSRRSTVSSTSPQISPSFPPSPASATDTSVSSVDSPLISPLSSCLPSIGSPATRRRS